MFKRIAEKCIAQKESSQNYSKETKWNLKFNNINGNLLKNKQFIAGAQCFRAQWFQNTFFGL